MSDISRPTEVSICSVSLSHVECFLEESDEVACVDDAEDCLESHALGVAQLGVSLDSTLRHNFQRGQEW